MEIVESSENLFNYYCGNNLLSSGSANVTFGSAQVDSNYRVLLTGNVAETFYVTNKTTTGFQIKSNNASSTANVDWFVSRTSAV